LRGKKQEQERTKKMYDTGIDYLQRCDGFERTPLGCVYTEEGLWWSVTEAEIVRLGEMLEAQDGSRDMGRGGYSEWCSLCGDEHRSEAAALRAVAGDLPQFVEASVAINPPGYTLVPATMTEIPVLTFAEAKAELLRQMEQFNDDELAEGRTGEVIYFDPATREPACIGIEARGDEVFREIEAATSAADLPSENLVDIEVKRWMLQGVTIERAPNENNGWLDGDADSLHFSRESAEDGMADFLREIFHETGSEWYTFDVDDEDAVDEAMEHISITMTEDVIEHDERGCCTNPLVINVTATIPYGLTAKGPE